MKKIVLLFFLLALSQASISQIIINEIETTGLERIELKNISNQFHDINYYILHSFPNHSIISNLLIISGNYMMAPGDIVVVNGYALGDTDGELALYQNYSFNNPGSMLDYLEWGSSFHVRSTIAQQAGIWTQGDFIPSPPANVSLEYDGSGDTSSDWNVQQNPTFGLENGMLSVSDVLLQASLTIYHSSDINSLTIKSDKKDLPLTKIEIYNVDGGLTFGIEQINKHAITISTKSIRHGVYILRVYSNNKMMVKKLIIS